MHLDILIDGVLFIGKDLPVDEFPSSVSIVSKLFFCHTLDALRDASVALVKNLGEGFHMTKRFYLLAHLLADVDQGDFVPGLGGNLGDSGSHQTSSNDHHLWRWMGQRSNVY